MAVKQTDSKKTTGALKLTAAPSEYGVRSGDTLSAIAARTGVPLATIVKLNPHIAFDGKDTNGRRRARDGHWIYPGDNLTLREAPKPEPRPPAPPPPPKPAPAPVDTSRVPPGVDKLQAIVDTPRLTQIEESTRREPAPQPANGGARSQPRTEKPPQSNPTASPPAKEPVKQQTPAQVPGGQASKELKNKGISTANAGAIANENFINALYLEASGRDATRAELQRWTGTPTLVKDAANIILGDRSPFAHAVIDRGAVPGAHSAEEAQRPASAPATEPAPAPRAEPPVTIQADPFIRPASVPMTQEPKPLSDAERETQRAEDEKRKQAAEAAEQDRKKAAKQEASRNKALDAYERMLDAAGRLGKKTDPELKKQERELRNLGIAPDVIEAVKVRVAARLAAAQSVGPGTPQDMIKTFDQNQQAAFQALTEYLERPVTNVDRQVDQVKQVRSQVMDHFKQAAESLGRLDGKERDTRFRQIEDLADLMHFHRMATFADMDAVRQATDLTRAMKEARATFDQATLELGGKNSEIAQAFDQSVPLPGLNEAFDDHARATTAAIGGFLEARVAGKLRDAERAKARALQAFNNAAHAAGRFSGSERQAADRVLVHLLDQIQYYRLATPRELQAPGGLAKAIESPARGDVPAPDDLEASLKKLNETIDAKEKANAIEQDRKQLTRAFVDLKERIYRLHPNSRADAVLKLKDLAQRIGYEFKPFETRQILDDPGDVNSPDPAEIEQARQALTMNGRKEEAARSGFSEQERAILDKVARLTEARPLSRRALQAMILDSRLPGPGGKLLDQLETLATQALAPRISREDLVSDLIAEIENPVRINQQGKGTCVPTTAQILLARQNPAEYLRIVSELGKPAGQAKAAGGATLKRVDDWDDGSDKGFRGAVRSVPSRLLQPSLMKLWSGFYDNSDDGGWLNWQTKLGFLSSGQASAKINKELQGREFESLESRESLRYTFDQAGGAAHDWERVKKALAEQKGPIPTGLYWEPLSPTPSKHEILVEKVEGGAVYYINPWGQSERMAEREFSAYLIGAQIP